MVGYPVDRLVPVCEELLSALERFRAAAESGETRIVQSVTDGAASLRTVFLRLIASAGPHWSGYAGLGRSRPAIYSRHVALTDDGAVTKRRSTKSLHCASRHIFLKGIAIVLCVYR